MSQKIDNEIVLDGHPDIQVARRTSIKLADKPRIIVAMPIGGKPVVDVFQDKDGKQYANQRGFRAQGLIPVHFMLSHMNWVPPLNVSMAYMTKMNMLSSHARQVMTMEAIRAGREYIFYVDDDTLIPPLGLYTLYNFMEQNPHAGAVTRRVHDPRDAERAADLHGARRGLRPGTSRWGLVPSRSCASERVLGACWLGSAPSRTWMENNPGVPIWADQKEIPSEAGEQSVMWGHDIRFCRMLNMAGFPVYVHGQRAVRPLRHPYGPDVRGSRDRAGLSEDPGPAGQHQHAAVLEPGLRR
jgi:hypothetical protein